VLPVISIYNINFFINWLYKISVHSGIYGRGERIIIEPNSFLLNIQKIFTSEWIFDVAYLSICASLFFWLKLNFKYVLQRFRNIFHDGFNGRLMYSDKNKNDTKFKLTLGIFLAMTFQVLIVSKHYALHYMFPSFMISVFAILTSVLFLSNSFEKKLTKKNLNLIYLIAITGITFYGTMFIYDYGTKLKLSAEESQKLLNYIESNSDKSVIVSTKLVSSSETALFAAITYAKDEVNNYKMILNNRYSQSIIYYDGRCYSFGDDDKIENIFKPADKILLVCSEDISVNQFLELLQNIYHIENITFNKIFSNNNGEMVYEIKTGNS
jgi:hypothetical protein